MEELFRGSLIYKARPPFDTMLQTAEEFLDRRKLV